MTDHLDTRLREASEIVSDALQAYQPSAMIGLFSGGHDNYTVTHFVASQFSDQLSAVCHIDTGIGIPETQQFVVDRCDAHGWDLRIYRAMENINSKGKPDPQDYDEIVRRLGFPGPHGHGMMFSRLKERQLRRITRDFISDRPVAFISGCRKEESARRMGTTEPVQDRGRNIWIAPFTYMTASDCDAYMRRHDLPKNPVKARLCMSGECLCGAFAKPNELQEIEFWYPDVGARIRRLEDEVRAAGFPWGWEESPPQWWIDRKHANKAGQADAFAAEAEHEIQMLCQSCHRRHESAVSEGQNDG